MNVECMAGRLIGKVAIVTGAAPVSPGIGNGKAAAILFAREGARVLLVNRARMERFLIFDYLHRTGEGLKQLAAWLREGRLNHREDIRDGLATAPAALAALYEGTNSGKMIVRVGEARGA